MRSVRMTLAACTLAAGVLAAGVLATPAAAAPPLELIFDDAEAAVDAVGHRSRGEDPDAAEAEAPPGEDAFEITETPSEVVEQFTGWVIASGDNSGQPFAVIDKVRAHLFIFDSDGRLMGEAPVLIGSALGDDSAPGVGELSLAKIPKDQRTTPAGRFKAVFGPAEGELTEVLWVDYDAAISLHPVLTNTTQRRVERLSTPTPLDNRITYGCINVPTGFYETVIRPAFTDAEPVFYVLPETRELEEVFPDFAWERGLT